MGCIPADWLTVVYVYIAIIVVNAVVLGIVSPLGWPVTVIGGTGTLLLLYAYSVVALSDPGLNLYTLLLYLYTFHS